MGGGGGLDRTRADGHGCEHTLLTKHIKEEEMLFFYHKSPSFLTNQMRQVWTPDLTRILKKVSSLLQCVLEGSSSGWIDALR